MSGLESDQIRYAIGVAQEKGYRQVKLRLGEDRFSAVLSAMAPQIEEEPLPAHEFVTNGAVQRDLNVASPSVGHFKALVNGPIEGDKVEPGDKVGEIIALGLVNEVTAQEKGTVVEVCVADGAPVQYGQPILILRQ